MSEHGSLKTIHAELAAIIQCKNKSKLKGATIVVYREKKNGELGMAKPCLICQKILKDFGFKNMMYTTEAGWTKEAV